MYGGAVKLAQKYNQGDFTPDLIIASDMLDLTTFLALIRHKSPKIPAGLYFHENQITYPWSPEDADPALQRDRHYGFINYISALAADHLLFNSQFHLNSFFEALPGFLKVFPDYRGLENVDVLKKKSSVLPLGLDLSSLNIPNKLEKTDTPVVLWNHRWEYDKNPELFFHTLRSLKEEGLLFKLIVTGKSYQKVPFIFSEAQKWFDQEIIHFGYAESFEAYAALLWQADILPVTSIQDFFGASVVEAIHCNCYPILPNRLAYPEHIPEAYQSECLFNSEKELYQKLKRAILNFEEIRRVKQSHNFVAQWDWRNLVHTYDNLFQRIKSARR